MKIESTLLTIAITCHAAACHADQSRPLPSISSGGIAQADAIYSSSRGQLFDDDASQDATPIATTTSDIRAVELPTNPLSASTSSTATAAPIASRLPPTATHATPMARGDLVEVAPPALTDNLIRNLTYSLGGLALSTSLDHRGDRFARDHGKNTAIKALTNAGNALPFIAIGAAGLVALDSTDTRLSRTGFSALQAGGASALSSFGLKYVFARARPEAELGSAAFHDTATSKGDSSLPSIHTATTWGIITPFAKEYDMPWLYGVALLTNFARVADRKHWFSDTVAGSLIGYWAGEIAWLRNKPKPETAAQVFIGERSITFAWPF